MDKLDSFDKRISHEERSKDFRCVSENGKILGHYRFVVYEEPDGKLVIEDGGGGGFFPHEMKKHMDNEMIKHLSEITKYVLKKNWETYPIQIFDLE